MSGVFLYFQRTTFSTHHGIYLETLGTFGLMGCSATVQLYIQLPACSSVDFNSLYYYKIQNSQCLWNCVAMFDKKLK